MAAHERPSRLPLAIVSLAWLVIVAWLGSGLLLDERLAAAGREDLVQANSLVAVPFLAAILSAGVVGSSLVVRRPSHPVGWLFLALAASVSSSALLDGYTAYGAVARPGALPITGFVATQADIVFIPWLTLLAFILLLTPSGRLASRASRLAAAASLGGGAVAFGVAHFRPYRGVFADLGTIENPLAPEALAGPLEVVGVAGLVVLHVGLLAATALVVLRFRARDTTGRRLRWLALAAIPFPVLVVGAWVAASMDSEEVVLPLIGGGFVAIIPIAAGLAIEQDHLYDVDRLLSRGLTYSLLTAGLIGCYAAVVFVLGRVLGDFGGDAQVPAVIATLVSVSLALPARARLQRALDRRFNRRQFEAVAAVRRFVREASPAATVERALQDALGDRRLSLAYWIDDRERWVDEGGNPADPGPRSFTIERRGAVVAALRFDAARNEQRTVDAVVAEALPEIENARLRAAIALQLVEVRESRARIVAAQLTERRKLERNLHDGAQQRLLAVAFQLRAAGVGEDPARVRTAIDAAIQHLQAAVVELRELANGLHPSALADGGLAAALDDLAARTPVAMRLDVTSERFAPPLEQAAWYIACEAVTNAVKHAAANHIDIAASRRLDRLCLTIEDDGCGGADPLGNGLRGITDRAEAAGGWLTVRPRAGAGTVVAAELPCG